MNIKNYGIVLNIFKSDGDGASITHNMQYVRQDSVEIMKSFVRPFEFKRVTLSIHSMLYHSIVFTTKGKRFTVGFLRTDFLRLFFSRHHLSPKNCKNIKDIPQFQSLPKWVQNAWLQIIYEIKVDNTHEYRDFFRNVKEDELEFEENDPEEDETTQMIERRHIYTFYFRPIILLREATQDGVKVPMNIRVFIKEVVEDAF